MRNNLTVLRSILVLMKWKLILQLSLFGLAMAIATVFWIPAYIEPVFWLIIFVICAFIIVQKCTGYYFWNGFLVCLVNCVWATLIHMVFYEKYIINHPREMAMFAKSVFESPAMAMLVKGVLIGAVSGIVLGFFSHIISLLLKPTTDDILKQNNP
jgi:hypothetical protein